MKRNLAALAEGREYDTAEPTVTMTQAELNAAIAAAVQAEREACAKVAENNAIAAASGCADVLAAAIRARNGAGRE